MVIERKGRATGRWPMYQLIVDGVNVGHIRRTLDGGGDRMSPHAKYDGWKIQGEILESQEKAEQRLIERAIQFGKLQRSAM